MERDFFLFAQVRPRICQNSGSGAEKRWQALSVGSETRVAFKAMIMAGAVLALGTMTLALLTLAVVMSFSESTRLMALFGLGLTYLVATLAGAWMLRARLKNWVSFQGTIGEMKKDVTVRRSRLTPRAAGVAGWRGETTVI